jgi:hypothetical protein
MTVDHLCNVPFCVNPDHMKLATRRENTLRGRRRFSIPIETVFGKRTIVAEAGIARCGKRLVVVAMK